MRLFFRGMRGRSQKLWRSSRGRIRRRFGRCLPRRRKCSRGWGPEAMRQEAGRRGTLTAQSQADSLPAPPFAKTAKDGAPKTKIKPKANADHKNKTEPKTKLTVRAYHQSPFA